MVVFQAGSLELSKWDLFYGTARYKKLRLNRAGAHLTWARISIPQQAFEPRVGFGINGLLDFFLLLLPDATDHVLGHMFDMNEPAKSSTTQP